jgi:hypothetical protein
MPADEMRASSWLIDCESRSAIEGDKHWRRSMGAGYAQHLLRQLAEARVPAVPDYMAGFDGAFYTLTITQGYNAVTYRWWPSAPKGHEPLVSFCNELLKIGGYKDRVAEMAEF